MFPAFLLQRKPPENAQSLVDMALLQSNSPYVVVVVWASVSHFPHGLPGLPLCYDPFCAVCRQLANDGADLLFLFPFAAADFLWRRVLR